MIIVSKDRKSAVNSDFITNFYIAYFAIKATVNGRNEQLAVYPSDDLAECAFTQLLKAFELSDKLRLWYMPQDAELLSRISAPKERYLNGKKTKGHGGS